MGEKLIALGENNINLSIQQQLTRAEQLHTIYLYIRTSDCAASHFRALTLSLMHPSEISWFGAVGL